MFSVSFGEKFLQEFKCFPKADQKKIIQFVDYVRKHGFVGLEGRNKSSINVLSTDPEFLAKVSYAREHNLWHYHIGIPEYTPDTPFGDRTSEWVLHYIRTDDTIKIIELGSHPPFKLPRQEYLK